MVEGDQALQVEVGEDVPVQHQEIAVANVRLDIFNRAGSAQGLVLGNVSDLEPEIRAVAKIRLDAVGKVAHGKDDLTDAVVPEPVQHIGDKRLIGQGHHRLGRSQRERAQARALAANEYDCFQKSSLRSGMLYGRNRGARERSGSAANLSRLDSITSTVNPSAALRRQLSGNGVINIAFPGAVHLAHGHDYKGEGVWRAGIGAQAHVCL